MLWTLLQGLELIFGITGPETYFMYPFLVIQYCVKKLLPSKRTLDPFFVDAAFYNMKIMKHYYLFHPFSVIFFLVS